MGFFSKLIPESIKKKFRRKKPLELRNNVPKEKLNIKKTFGIYCNQKHGTKSGKLCPKCTALLATIMPKISNCRYGQTKPICDRCDDMCFGAEYNKIFMEAMTSNSGKMLVRHPVMSVKHKLLGIGVDYAKSEQEKRATDKKIASAKRKAEKKAKREKNKESKS